MAESHAVEPVGHHHRVLRLPAVQHHGRVGLREAVFPSSSPAVSTIAAFGTLAVGYVARPLGGLVFGRRTVSLTGAAVAVLYAFPLYSMIDAGSVAVLTVALMLGQVVQSAMYAPPRADAL